MLTQSTSLSDRNRIIFRHVLSLYKVILYLNLHKSLYIFLAVAVQEVQFLELSLKMTVFHMFLAVN